MTRLVMAIAGACVAFVLGMVYADSDPLPPRITVRVPRDADEYAATGI